MTVGAITLLVDPTNMIFEPSFTPMPSPVTVSLSRVADTYVIQTFDTDSHFRVFAEGEITEDQGMPLPAESVLNERNDPKDTHLDFFCPSHTSLQIPTGCHVVTVDGNRFIMRARHASFCQVEEYSAYGLRVSPAK